MHIRVPAATAKAIKLAALEAEQTISEFVLGFLPADVTARYKDVAERQQVGARVPKVKYCQLKAHAALEGTSVQSLVERAISEFLSRP